MNTCARSALLILFCWLAPYAPVFSQGDRSDTRTALPVSESHLTLPSASDLLLGSAADKWIEQLLAQQQMIQGLQQQRAQDTVRKLLHNSKEFQQRLQALPEKERERLKSAVEAFRTAGPSKTPDQQAALEDQASKLAPLLQNLLGGRQGSVNPPGEDQFFQALLKAHQESSDGKAGSSMPVVPKVAKRPSEKFSGDPPKRRPPPRRDKPATPAPKVERQESPFAEQLTRRLANWAENNRVGSALARSPSWQRMMESLGRYRQDEGTMNVSGGADSLLQRWGLEAGFSKLLSTETWNFRPSLPTPSLNLSSYLPSTAPGGPNWTAPKANLSGGASAGFFRGLLWVALAGVLGVLVWRLLGAKKRGSGVQGLAEANRMRSLGPWPVAPQEVKTRSEFIQAFEYLSLLLLGRDARNWNHRQIGATLAGANRAREEQQAARVLTALYETARYAPATQAVTADDLAQARRHLCLLAGVAAA